MQAGDTSSEAATVLVVDDDAAVCWSIEQALTKAGYQCLVCADAASARRRLRSARPDLVLTDVRMPGESGLDLLADLRQQYRHLPVVVMTAHGTMQTAMQAVQQGAFDYLTKPLGSEQLLEVVRRALGEDQLALSCSGIEATAADSIIGSGAAMQEVYRRLAAAAGTDVGVLITGPSGSGKELVARALHQHSRRREAPFIAVNCGALPDHLVESELFGHEAGAFTDAKQRKLGRIEAADGGTLFLDEIGELPPAAQVKLLRFLEDQVLRRVGGEDEIQLNVRVVAATNRDLAAATEMGSFRPDLAYRLRVVHIALPALSERREDLEDLVRHFLQRAARRFARPLAITVPAMHVLRAYTWPGNVRELKHVLEEAAVLATGGIIDAPHLRISGSSDQAQVTDRLDRLLRQQTAKLIDSTPGSVLAAITDLIEAPVLAEALSHCRGNQLRAAELLGINRITLKKRMDQLGIDKGGMVSRSEEETPPVP